MTNRRACYTTPGGTRSRTAGDRHDEPACRVDTRADFVSLQSMMSRARSVALALFLSIGVAPPLSAATDDQPAAASSIFEYDRSADLAVQASEPVLRDGAFMTDVSFAGASGRVRAYVVSPIDASAGSRAGVLYVHWLGTPVTTNRTEFLNEALALASQGIVSVLVDAMWATPKWYPNRVPEKDYENSVAQVIDLRRALDLLLAQPGVDPSRIAFVGHDFGAMFGIVMGAVDRRPSTYVLMAGTPRFIDWMLFARQPEDPAAYRAQMAPLDPVRFVAQLAPAPVFFQFAATDEYVSAEAAAQFYAAAGPRKQMATYAGGHDLQNPEAAADRITWLVRELARK